VTEIHNRWLVAAGLGCVLAAVAHLAIIAGGPDWYRLMGAGEPMAQAAARGAMFPAVLTGGIAAVLAGWALYAFSGAGLVRRLPLVRTALVAITLVLAGRGLAILVPDLWRPDLPFTFKLWSSIVVLALAVCFAFGTWRAWPALCAKDRS
jgi:hypothetical protein